MGKKKHREQQTAPIPRREICAWLIVLGICGIIIAYCVTYLATHPGGRSIYGNGKDIYLINATVTEIQTSSVSNKLPASLCYVSFGDQGSLLLDDEWLEKFEVGEAYHIFVTNRKGRLEDRIITYEWIGGKS